MFYITDTFNVASVSLKYISEIRFEEITQNQFKKMCDGSDKQISFSDRNVLGYVNRLLGEIHKVEECTQAPRLEPTDVVVLFQQRRFTNASENPKIFKVTCRRDYEVFDINGVPVILDRDGNVVDHGETAPDTHTLKAKCQELNLAH